MEIKEQIISVKNYVTKSNLPDCDFVINPYVGCPHACKYCYACFMKRFTNHAEKWGTFIDIKTCPNPVNTAKLKNSRVFLSSVTDCYIPLEEKYHIIRDILRQLAAADCEITISTKSALILRDVELLAGTRIRAALVSTNSVTQGETVANLWKPLFASGVHFDFAHRTFRWDSEANQKAHVHCVIVGFSAADNPAPKRIFDNGTEKTVKNINGYLIEAPNVFVESRNRPLFDVPEIGIGNKPIDDGNYLFSKAEMEAFVRKEPAAKKYFRLWFGSYEFINRCPRYCLWLGECSPAELRKMPECMKRMEAVRKFRLASKSEGTRKLADTPTRFHVENMPEGNYLLIPRVSSERRRYVPIGFMAANALSSDSVHIIPDATLYHFGVLTSNVHMAWMRAVCGRLEMRYRYSKDIVYNNFPWPSPSDEQKTKIEQTAQGILDARALYPDSSLADLYDELTMPPELRRAHQANDRAVMAAYGFSLKMKESECTAALMNLYQKLTAR